LGRASSPVLSGLSVLEAFGFLRSDGVLLHPAPSWYFGPGEQPGFVWLSVHEAVGFCGWMRR
jgi:hypothetical protein